MKIFSLDAEYFHVNRLTDTAKVTNYTNRKKSLNYSLPTHRSSNIQLQIYPRKL